MYVQILNLCHPCIEHSQNNGGECTFCPHNVAVSTYYKERLGSVNKMSIDLAKDFQKFLRYFLFPSTQRMGTSCCSEMSGYLYQTTRSHILKGGIHYSNCSENMKFQIYTTMWNISSILVA